MTLWQAFFLGVVQGLTEFLPISSSGHLALFQTLFGFQDLKNYIPFDIVCHGGTLAAICLIFKKEIVLAIKEPKWQLALFLGTLPLFPLVFLIKPIKAIFDDPFYLGFCFLFTALLLSLAQKCTKSLSFKERESALSKNALGIGVFQALAILPGISRSGSTICCARFFGWDPKDAAAFSFLLAIPAILGGIVFEALHLIKDYHLQATLPPVSVSAYVVGFFASFAFGMASLKVMLNLVANNRLKGFAIYCALLGLSLIAFFFNP